MYRIRLACSEDAAAVLEMYAPYVTSTTVSFEIEPPSVDEYSQRIQSALDRYTFLVLEQLDASAADGEADGSVAGDIAAGDGAGSNGAGDDRQGNGRIIGFASYGPFGHRKAYQWSAEISIYLRQGFTGNGLGAHLLNALEDIMASAGITNSEACICSENTGSIEFHRRHGYRACAEFTDCASKFGRWLGIQWLEKHLAPHPSNPVPPHAPLPQDCERILAAANERLASSYRG